MSCDCCLIEETYSILHICFSQLTTHCHAICIMAMALLADIAVASVMRKVEFTSTVADATCHTQLQLL